MIKKVALLGLGALGAIYARALASKGSECDFYAIMDEKRASRFLADGFFVNGDPVAVDVRSPDDGGDGADLLIVALKYPELALSLSAVAGHVGPQTQILLPLNGLASEAMAADLFGWERVLYSVASGVDSRRNGNRVTMRASGLICFGEADNSLPSPRVEAVKAFFDRVGIPCRVPENMLRLLWWKLMVNVGINQVAAVVGGRYRAFQKPGPARDLMLQAQRETIRVANAAGVDLGEEDIREWLGQLDGLSADGRPSTLQDLEMGRKTEVDYLGRAVVELGEKYGVPTPVNSMLVQLVHAAEDVRGAK